MFYSNHKMVRVEKEQKTESSTLENSLSGLMITWSTGSNILLSFLLL